MKVFEDTMGIRQMADINDDDYTGFNISYIPERIGTWIIDIDGPIERASQFANAIQVLNQANEDNPVQINLQCPGGSLGATDALLHAMRKCKGPIHVVATGNCSSAATLIILEANSFELSDGFSSLLHCGSIGNIGNLNEYTSQASFDTKFMPRILREAYEGFLSEDEIDRLLDGKDIWLDADGWMERHKRRIEYFQKKEAGNLRAEKKRKPRAKKQTKEVPEEV